MISDHCQLKFSSLPALSFHETLGFAAGWTCCNAVVMCMSTLSRTRGEEGAQSRAFCTFWEVPRLAPEPADINRLALISLGFGSSP